MHIEKIKNIKYIYIYIYISMIKKHMYISKQTCHKIPINP